MCTKTISSNNVDNVFVFDGQTRLLYIAGTFRYNYDYSEGLKELCILHNYGQR